jgi:hypothetical protein
LEEEISSRNTLANEQENPSSMQNKVRILQWSNIRMTSNYLHWPTKFGSEPRNFAWRIHMLQVRNNSETVPTCKNRISLMQMTCGWLPLGELFFLGLFCVVHSCPALMKRVDKGSFQRLPISIPSKVHSRGSKSQYLQRFSVHVRSWHQQGSQWCFTDLKGNKHDSVIHCIPHNTRTRNISFYYCSMMPKRRIRKINFIHCMYAAKDKGISVSVLCRQREGY